MSRREARRHDRRDAILSVASHYFLEHGYAGTTMSAIAAMLGGSKGTLWSYFPSKEELFAAVLDRATADYRVRMSEILATSGDLDVTLRHFCANLMEKITSPEAIALHRLVVAEAGRFPEMGKIFYDRGPKVGQARLADFLSEAMTDGKLFREDALSASRLLTSICMSGCHQQLLLGQLDRPTPEMIEADIERAVSLFLRAYSVD